MSLANFVQSGAISVEKIKEEVKDNLGKRVEIREFNKQKKLISNVQGEITGVYKNIFTVIVERNGLSMNRSYNYYDISVGLIEIDYL